MRSDWTASVGLLLLTAVAAAGLVSEAIARNNELIWGERAWLGLLCCFVFAILAIGLLALAVAGRWLLGRLRAGRSDRLPPWVDVLAVLGAVAVPVTVGWLTGGGLPAQVLGALTLATWLCCALPPHRAKALDWRPLGVALVLVLVLWMVFSAVSSSRGEARRVADEARFTKVTDDLNLNGRRLLVIGIDGLSWQFFEAMRQRGELPNLSRLAETGVAVPLGSLRPTESARLWTTVASGEPAERHGVESFFAYGLPGLERPLILRFPNGTGLPRLLELAVGQGWARREPVSSYNCRSPRLWEIVEAAGGRAAVLGWWATWPAQSARGVMVSDTFYYHHGGQEVPQLGSGESYGVVWPPALQAEMESLRRSPRSVTDVEVRRFLDRSPDQIEAMRDQAWQPTLDDQFLYLYSMDRTYANLALHLLREQPELDLMAVYLRGLDTVSHLALEHGNPQVPATPKSAADLVRAYYAFTDQLVGEFLVAAGDERGILLLSDHGFAANAEGQWDHEEAPPGVLLAAGSGFGAADSPPVAADLFDVFPTASTYFGLPVVAGQPGAPLGILEGQLNASPEPVASYGRPLRPAPADLAAGEAAREEEVLRLRALGYGG